MKIYIYGNQSFKKEIHQTLEHSNIKFRMDSNFEIEDINNLSKLKQTIIENPNDVYLIDDKKIIKKNSLNKKIKFLTPSDGIEEEFLLESGVADLSLDSMKELPKYIIKKYEELKEDEPNISELKENKLIEKHQEEELDEELAMLLEKGSLENLIDEDYSINLNNELDTQKDINLDDIDDFITSLSDSQNNESNEIDNFKEVMNFNDNFGLNNISYDYDDDDVMFREENITIDENKVNEFDELDFFDKAITENDENEEDFLDLNELDFLNERIEKPKQKISEEIKKEIKQIDKSLQGDKMIDEFFELDSISEKDLLDALNYQVDEKSTKEKFNPLSLIAKEEVLTINSSNVNDLSQLISKLLTNKTLEITIKIKD